MSTETKPAYSPGLAGVVAGETEICWVDPNAGLMYRGYDIHDMAEQASFEEVAYLLLNGELPNFEELGKFTREIARRPRVTGAGRKDAAALAARDASNGHVAHGGFDVGCLR